MNQYILLRRLRGPIMLLVFGVTAILDEYTRVHYGESWPLYIIAWGILKLAENAILAQNPPAPPSAWPGYNPAPGSGNPPWSGSPATPDTQPPTSTAITPVHGDEGR